MGPPGWKETVFSSLQSSAASFLPPQMWGWHFEFIFVYGVGECSHFIILCVLVVFQFSQHNY